MTDDRSTPLAHEEVELTDGLGLIEVAGDRFDAVLTVAARPVLVHWDDCSGSIVQYLLRLEPMPGFEDHLAAMRAFVDDGWDESMPLAEQVAPALRLFRNGPFALVLEDQEPAWSLDTSEKEARFYPDWSGCLIETLDRSRLDPSAVERHALAIARGTRPCVIACGRYDTEEEHVFCRYVIDGHHKLEAYRRASAEPRVCTIVCRDPQPITPEQGKALVRTSRHKRHYMSWKKKQ